VGARHRWYFYNGALHLSSGPCQFIAAIGEVEVDGVTPDNETDLNAALGPVFPVPAGSTPTLNDVLLQGNNAGNSRILNVAGPQGAKDVANKDYVDNFNAGFLRYTALLTQSGTNPPVVTELLNEIGLIEWTYVAPGQYTGVLPGAFPEGKTFLLIGHTPGARFFSFYRDDSNGVTVTTTDTSNFGVNGVLDATSIEVRIYP
jgi:hypothetical protein